MFEADGSDDEAIRKQGLTHLFLVRKPVTLEAERHHGIEWILE